MAQVAVKINGYGYTVGCEDGQEPHLLRMSAEIEARISSIKALGGGSGEARLLVLAALLMADELHDLRAELDQAKGATRPPSAPPALPADFVRRVIRMAARAEEIVSDFEHP